ncbi:MAG: amidohydrolase family protein [Desulfobacteraceae bacterium]|jgi:predicted TIM-barrel fold metal-dependent hydrolase
MTIIDVHTHIFPPEIRSQRGRFFSNEPEFELLYRSATSKMAGAGETVSMMDEQGVDRAVVMGFPWRSIETARRHNDYIMDAVGRHPTRLIGFCCFDPLHPAAANEAQRCLEAGLSGIGELAFYSSGIDDRCLDALDPVMALARRHRCVVMLHTNEPVGHQYPGKSPNTLSQIYNLAKRFSDNRLILAHWGGGIFMYTLLKKEIRQVLSNIWFDTAASPYLYQVQIYRQAIELAGLDKVLFGSDHPLLKPDRYMKELAAAGLDESQQAAICGANTAKLLNLC